MDNFHILKTEFYFCNSTIMLAFDLGYKYLRTKESKTMNKIILAVATATVMITSPVFAGDAAAGKAKAAMCAACHGANGVSAVPTYPNLAGQKAAYLAKQIKDFVPQPDPMEEKMKELQIALLEAQIDKEISMAEENRAEAQLDMAKAQAELAGIGKTQSETDKNNLDYVEQETGTTQARELEKSSEQAKGNMALKILESKLAPKEGKN